MATSIYDADASLLNASNDTASSRASTIYNTAWSPYLADTEMARVLQAANEHSFKYAGAGSFYGQYQNVMSKIDRYGINPILQNHEVSGLTFITRPKLNLAMDSIRQDRHLGILDTIDERSLNFAIRCLLDTNFAARNDLRGQTSKNPFFTDVSPFIIPATNCLKMISGWPDFTIDTETTEGGFFQEDYTFAIGSEMGLRSFELTLTFRDIQGGVIRSLFYYWLRWIALACRGTVVPYWEDIFHQRLCYTCSIYRFVLDPSKRFIVAWAKATGCFPKSLPIGNVFNIGERESWLSASMEWSIPFACNFVQYNDPAIFSDFNRIALQYYPQLDSSDLVKAPAVPQNNFCGMPYIDMYNGTNELMFMCGREELVNPLDSVFSNLSTEMNARILANLQ